MYSKFSGNISHRFRIVYFMKKEIVSKKSFAKLELFTRRRSWRHPIQLVRGRMRCDPSTQIVARFVREFDSHFMWATERHANDTDKIRIIDIFARFPRRTHERSFRKKALDFFHITLTVENSSLTEVKRLQKYYWQKNHITNK